MSSVIVDIVMAPGKNGADVRRNEPVIRDAVAGLSSLDEVIRLLDI